ncbi:cysteine-rich CWC family protein [Hahella sp. CR1]|uniref:cysteine-rich CWC family protein n=1 Tax=Hahella sp. CR1 TaxID=2992807 RepID=UPI0024418339|nr:cysteine-rich CWC family protein [Hahella sp. CR1]MDG9668931.1 cysteine-rich CWC family protein [Hahella sp. CR1]
MKNAVNIAFPDPAYSHACPGCGRPAQCDLEKGKSTCWCFSLPPSGLTSELFTEGAKCYCRSCLNERLKAKQSEADAAD